MIRFVSYCLAVAALCCSLSSFADDKAKAGPPAKMSREDMLDIRNAGLELNELQRQANDIVKHRDDVLGRYGVTFDELGKSVSIAGDGTIQRAPAPPPAKPPKK